MKLEILPTLKFSIRNESQHWMFRCGDIEIANIFVDKGNLAFRWADNGEEGPGQTCCGIAHFK